MKPDSHRQKRILVVDDLKDITRLWQIFLERAGYVVEAENHSLLALQTARRFRPDVIILDMDMPVIDGGEIAATLRGDEQFRETIVIFVTSLVTAAEAAAGKRIEGCPCLPKPPNGGALLAMIEGGSPPVRSHRRRPVPA